MNTKIGRNAPCPCGSGQKYKRCCSEKDERERREQAAAEARWNTDIWFPAADDLQLPDIPDALRPEARRVLGSALPLMFERGIGIKAGTCWLVAQGLTAVANGEIGYVEGCWTRSSTNPWHETDDDTDIAAHAWNSYQGHTIELIAEFYTWRSFGEDSPWLHEPLKEYSLEELRGLDYFDETIDSRSDYGDISSGVLVPYESLPEHLRNEPDYHASGKFDGKLFDEFYKKLHEYLDQVTFKDARARLLARINSTTHGSAAIKPFAPHKEAA